MESTRQNAKQTEMTTTLSNKSDTWHTHDERYYTRTEIDNKNLLSGGSYLRWLPGAYIDSPNSYFNLTGWNVVMYFSLVNLSSTAWSAVIGVCDNNNGTPQGRQLAVGTLGTRERRYTDGKWGTWS